MGIRVPVYEQQTQQAQAAPEQRAARLPDSGLGQLGQTIGGIGMQMKQAADEEFARVAKLRLDDAQNQMLKVDAQLDLERQKLVGKAALEPIDGKSPLAQFDERRAAAVEEITKSLGNQRLQESFKGLAEQHGTKFAVRGAEHQAQQQKVYEASVTEGTLTTAHQLVQSDPASTDTFNEQASRALSGLAGFYERQGLSSEEAQAKVVQAQSDLFATRLIALSDPKTGNPNMAKKLLDETPDALVGPRKDQITKLVNKEAAGFDVQVMANQITLEAPKDVDARARELAGSDSEKLALLRHELDYRKGAAKQAQQETDIAVSSPMLTSMLAGKTSWRETQRQLDMNTVLSPKAKADLEGHIYSFKRQQEAEWRQGKAEAREALWPDFLKAITSEQLPFMPMDEAVKIASAYGPGLGGKFMAHYNRATAEGPGITISPNARATAMAQVYGPNWEKMVKDTKNPASEQLATAVMLAGEHFAAESRGKGEYATKKPTPKEQADYLVKLLNGVPTAKGFFGGPAGIVPRMSLSPEQTAAAARLYPDDETRVALALLDSRKQPHTESTTLDALIELRALRNSIDPAKQAMFTALYNRVVKPTATTPYTVPASSRSMQ